MRLLSLVVIPLVAACNAAPPKAEPIAMPALNYTLEPSGEAVAVSLAMAGEADGDTKLRLGAPYGADRTPHTRFGALSATSTEGEVTLQRDQSRLTLSHPPGATLDIRYQWDRPTDPAIYGHSPLGLAALGYTLLAVPESDERFMVSVDSEGFAPGWTLAVSPALRGAATADDVLASGLMLGPLDIAGSPDGVRVGVLGGAAFDADALAEAVAPLLAAQARLWGDTPGAFDVMIATQAAPDPSQMSLTGTGLRDAFFAQGTDNVPLDALSGFLSHEVAHNWMPRRIGQPVGARGELYWFTEGMTEFLAQRARVEAGVVGADGMVEAVNAALEELALSPVKSLPNAQAAALFWEDPDAERLPYLRGFLLAMRWDAEMRAAGGGLMTTFRDMANSAPLDLSPELIAARFDAGGTVDARADIARFVEEGQPLALPANMFGECYAQAMQEVRPYDVGFDPGASFASGEVTGVVPEHNAFAAGLRDGMAFEGKVSGGGGDRTADIVLAVSDAKGTREIAYRPVSPQTIDVPQFAAQPCD